jgi:hypothetical protein
VIRLRESARKSPLRNSAGIWPQRKTATFARHYLASGSLLAFYSHEDALQGWAWPGKSVVFQLQIENVNHLIAFLIRKTLAVHSSFLLVVSVAVIHALSASPCAEYSTPLRTTGRTTEAAILFPHASDGMMAATNNKMEGAFTVQSLESADCASET